MKTRWSGLLLTSCWLFIACGKKSDGPTATAKLKPTCSPGAWKEPTGLFCLDAPAGFKATVQTNVNQDNSDPESRVTFVRNSPSEAFTVEWFPKRGSTEALTIASNMENDYKNNKGEGKGNFAQGKGKYFAYTRKDEAKSHKFVSVVKGNKHAYDCEASSWDVPVPKDAIGACKSLTPTD
jgi:hypothetical protein